LSCSRARRVSPNRAILLCAPVFFLWAFRVLTEFVQPGDLTAPTTRQTLPLPSAHVHEKPRKITPEEREFSAYKTLRNNRAEARFEGARKIRAAKASCSPLDLPVRLLTVTMFYRRKKRRRLRRSSLVFVAHFSFIALSCMLFKTWVLHGIWHCMKTLHEPGYDIHIIKANWYKSMYDEVLVRFSIHRLSDFRVGNDFHDP
jgi:hypothetical protein